MAIQGKKRLLLITALSLFFLASVIVSSRLFWGSNYMAFKVNTPTYVVDKLRTGENSGGNVELTEADFNALLQLQLKGKNQQASLQFNGIYAKISEGNLCVYVPAHYHSLSFLISTAGKLEYHGSLLFKPDYIQVGKFQFPIQWTMRKLSSNPIADFGVKDNGTIEISKEFIPFKIKTLSINGDKLVLTFEKPIQTANVTEQKPSDNQNTQKSLSASGNSNSRRAELLRRANSQLSSVYGAVKTQEEKNIIGQIQTVVGRMVDNPNYSYSAESQQVKEKYNRLTSEERSDFKDAILMNMDTSTLREIKGTFSL